MRGRKMSPTTERIIDLLDSDMTYKEIALLTGVTRQRVGQIACVYKKRYQGAFLYNLSKMIRGNERLRLRLEDKKRKRLNRQTLVQHMRYLVEDEGMSYNEAARTMGKAPGWLMTICKKNGIKSQHKSCNPAYR